MAESNEGGVRVERRVERGSEAYQEWKPWIWHKPACCVVSIEDHDHMRCTCGLAQKLKAIGIEDPREHGLDHEDIAAMG